uniref:Uncharacterized protein n=1 Tax=Anopheles atroparvus TaxID=41427 RepID=A0AAG5D4V6_ANOAO
MSSPAERSTMSSSSKYDDKSPPLYPSTDRFNPLGFSTPQQEQRGYSSQQRNYYSAQPKYMLPRSRGFHNHPRAGQNEYHDRTPVAQEPDDTDPVRNSNADAGRSNYNRNWRGNQNRNQRFGGQRHQHNFRQKYQGRDACYNIEDYFHPSMLEDPWDFLLRRTALPNNEQAERSMTQERMREANAAAGDSCNSAEEG